MRQINNVNVSSCNLRFAKSKDLKFRLNNTIKQILHILCGQYIRFFYGVSLHEEQSELMYPLSSLLIPVGNCSVTVKSVMNHETKTTLEHTKR